MVGVQKQADFNKLNLAFFITEHPCSQQYIFQDHIYTAKPPGYCTIRSFSEEIVSGLRIGPADDRDKVGDKAGHAALQERLIAKDDLLRAPVGVVRLPHHCNQEGVRGGGGDCYRSTMLA
jgi:hypothetical protein